MLTLPSIIERPAQPYAGIRREVTMPFDDVIEECFEKLFKWLEQSGAKPAGAAFIKYDVVRMPELVVEFGVPLAAGVDVAGGMVAGVLPAGRYAALTNWGHYDELMEVTTMLVGWARQKDLRWDSRETSEGEAFACRLEIYETDPAEEPDPDKWETRLEFKLAD